MKSCESAGLYDLLLPVLGRLADSQVCESPGTLGKQSETDKSPPATLGGAAGGTPGGPTWGASGERRLGRRLIIFAISGFVYTRQV